MIEMVHGFDEVRIDWEAFYGKEYVEVYVSDDDGTQQGIGCVTIEEERFIDGLSKLLAEKGYKIIKEEEKND